ncbi:MAG: hypothetical protein RIS75_1227, partial [Actinomycetota bacterium]
LAKLQSSAKVILDTRGLLSGANVDRL